MTRWAQGREVREMRDADTILTIIRGRPCEGTDPGHESLESRMRSKPHVRFGGGRMEKGVAGCPSLPTHYGLDEPRHKPHLASRLPYLLTRSSTGIASAFTPALQLGDQVVG